MALGVELATVRAAVHRGLSEYHADRWAIRLGFHPSLIWPDWFDDAPAWTDEEEGSVVCASSDCDTMFLPSRHRLYCSERCKQREKMRRRRATPEGQDQNRRHRAAYYEECGGYENERRRRERAA